MTDEKNVTFKFEKLEVWQLALEYIDTVYLIAEQLPRSEEFNLKSQIIRAATPIALNIAGDSTGQTDSEQARFLGLAIHSLIETVACLRIINRRKLLKDASFLDDANQRAQTLTAKLHTMRRTLEPERKWLCEERELYLVEDE